MLFSVVLIHTESEALFHFEHALFRIFRRHGENPLERDSSLGREVRTEVLDGLAVGSLVLDQAFEVGKFLLGAVDVHFVDEAERRLEQEVGLVQLQLPVQEHQGLEGGPLGGGRVELEAVDVDDE